MGCMTTRYEQQKSRQRDNDLLCWASAIVGVVVIATWIALEVVYPGIGLWIVGLLGALLIVLGIVFMGRKPRSR